MKAAAEQPALHEANIGILEDLRQILLSQRDVGQNCGSLLQMRQQAAFIPCRYTTVHIRYACTCIRHCLTQFMMLLKDQLCNEVQV